MNVTADDIAGLRAAKLSDDTILDKLKQYNPADANDIEALKKHGMASGEILDKYVKWKAQYPEKPATDSGTAATSALDTATLLGKAAAYGIGDEASRISSTLKNTGVGDGATTKAVADLANGLANTQGQYDPASSHVGLNPSTWSYIPRALIESAPSLGGYAAGGAAGAELGSAIGSVVPVVGTTIGAGIGGLAGAGAYGLMHHLGRDSDTRAANNGRTEATPQDVAEALPGALAEAGLDAAGSRFVLGHAPGLSEIKGAGLKALGQTAGNVAKTGVANAGTGAASDVAHQLGTTVGTDKGATLDPDEVARAAQAAGVLAAAQKGIGSVPEAITSVRLGGLGTTDKFDPKYRQQVADDIKSTLISGNPDEPKDRSKIVTNGTAIYSKQVQDAIKSASATVKAGEADGVDTGNLSSKVVLASNLMTNLRSSSLDRDQIAEAKQELPSSILDPMMKLNVMKQLGEQAGVKERATSTPSVFDAIRLAHEAKRLAFMGGVASAAVGHPAGLALSGIPVGVFLGGKALSGLTRSPYTVSDFTNRFGSDPSAQPQVMPQVMPKLLSPPSAIPMGEPPAPEPINRGVSRNGSWEPQGPYQPITDPARLLPAPPIYGHDQRLSRPLSQDELVASLRGAGKPAGGQSGILDQVFKATNDSPPEPPQAQQAASPSVEPGITKITTGSNSRMQADDDVRRSHAAIGAGMESRTQLRNELIDGLDTNKLSKQGRDTWKSNKEDFRTRVNGNNTQTASAGRSEIEALSRRFTPLDKAIIDHHFTNAKAKDGRRFLDAWKHADKAALDKAKKTNKAVNKAKKTKRKRGQIK